MAVRVLGALIALQVGVGGVAVATVEKPDRLATGGNTATSDTTVPGEAQVGPDGQPITDPNAAPAAPADGNPPGEAPVPGQAAADRNSLPERPGPPRPGAYRYRTKGEGQASFGTFTTTFADEQETDTRFEAVAGAAPGEARDRERNESSGSSGSMNFSGSAVRERSWRGDGMFVMSESSAGQAEGDEAEGGEEFRADCDWQPDVKELAFPLREGAAWSWDSTCESKSENADTTQRYTGQARVTGTRTATVAGRDLRVLVIERESARDVDSTFRRDGREFENKAHFEETSTILFAPSVSLPIRTDSKFKGTSESPQTPGQQGRFEGNSASELLSLDPK